LNNPTAQASQPRKWTFMVYMAAGDSHKLDTVAVRDLQEMEIGTKGNGNVAVVVQVNRHWPKAAQRYEISSNGTTLLDSPTGPTNMGDPETLKQFVTTVLSKDAYRAEHYCLVLWGHAFGVGFGRDEEDPLLLDELSDVLEDLKDARSGKPLELLGTNACSMSYLEAAFELKDVVSLMVASQITVPFAGWPYGVILNRVTQDLSPIELAKVIVDAYVTQFDDLPGGDQLAMTMLNLTHAGICGEHLRTLASKIHDEISGGFDTDTMATLRDTFMGAAAGDVRPLIDLTTLCEILRGDRPDKMATPIVDAATALLAALQPSGPPLSTANLTPKVNQEKLVAYHRAHRELIDLKGIGIYAPFVTDQGILDRLQLARRKPDGLTGSLQRGWDDYEKLALFNGRKRERGTWPVLVYDELKRTIPAELMVEIDGIGELQTGDRADVAQIIMSIEAVLNGLDRAIARSRRDIIEAITDGPPKPAVAPSARNIESVGTLATPTTAFGPPWLRLLPPLSLQALKEADELKNQQAKGTAGLYLLSGQSGQRLDVVDRAVECFKLIELAISVTERVIRRGLTHARFGLGPYSPNKLIAAPGLGLGPGDLKSGSGPGDLKSGSGPGDLKSGSGPGDLKSGSGDVGVTLRPGLASGDLRADLALLRVADLFKQVGESLITLEAAAADVEAAARALLVVAPLSTPNPEDAYEATAQELDQRFGVLMEASGETRRTLRRVLAHPVYGLGPGEEPLSLDVREGLALHGGLSRRFLRLL
jgi:hypothetical protein